MSNLDKVEKILQPECLDEYGLKPCTAEYLELMRSVVQINSYDVKSFFADHDPLEFGTVSEHIFKCVLHEKFMCQCGFSLEQNQLIMDFFRMPDGNICYMRLVALMNSTENIAQQLRECATKVAMPQTSEAPLRICGARVFGTEVCIPSVLERLRTAYWRLRIKLTDLFRCCDSECKGLVHEDKFRCILKSSLVPEAGITERQLDGVTNYYRACGSMIDYKRMADMFDSTLSLQEQYQLNYITKRDELKVGKKVNKLSDCDEEKIKSIWSKIVTRASPHILTSVVPSYFEKFAHRQSGETTVPHLKRFIEYIYANIAESDFVLLCKKYATSDYNVNFIQLIEDLDDAYHKHFCNENPPKPILGADGPPYDDLSYFPMGDGAGRYSSVWAHGACTCASQDEHDLGKCLPPDSSRFYEGGTVCGGIGRVPVWGREYVKNRLGAIPGQRYGGSFISSPPAGQPTGLPVGKITEQVPSPGMSESVELIKLMERLQQFLYRFRIRTKDFFKPFDSLNSGLVSANQFRRALYNMGIGGTGRMNLGEHEFDALINFYRSEREPSKACWRKFDADIESIFVQRELEKLPSVLTPSPERIINLPNPGATNMEDVPLHIRQLAQCAVSRLRHRIIIESCNIKYFLKSFDQTGNGYISRQQFKQTLSMLNYSFSPDELEAMSVLYCDEKGFSYLKLLKDIEPQAQDAGWYAKYKNGRLYQLNLPPREPKWKEHDIQRIMYKINAKMVRCRPQLDAFLRDHDLFHHDRIKIIDFHRAMDRAGFELTPREIEVLSCCYRSPDDETEIEWRCLFQSSESVFSIFNLETAPRLVPTQWSPTREMDYEKEMSRAQYCSLADGMRRLSGRVKERRIEFRPMFLDFDRPLSGLVSADQFHRVLQTVGLADIVTEEELGAIVRRFSVVRGGKTDVDYVEFLSRLEGVSYVDPITLEEQSPTGVEWYKQLHPNQNCTC